MSSIGGIWHRDGQPVQPQGFSFMMSALESFGKSGTGHWKKGPVAVGHCLSRCTPESHYEVMPLVSPDGRLVLVADARLYNRDELFHELGVSVSDQENFPDGALILSAYEKWGENCPDHLIGDWAFAVWDTTSSSLFLARDHGGTGEIYYSQSGQSVFFSSRIAGLLALPDIYQKPNEFQILTKMLHWSSGSNETAYQGIFFLFPGHALRITKNELKTWAYWDLQNIPELKLKEDRDYAEALLNVLGTAVQSRLRCSRKIGVMLSAGLDSSSIACLASRFTESGNRLQAFTSVPMHATTGLISVDKNGDEGDIASETCRLLGNIDHHRVSAEKLSPIDGLRKLIDFSDQPDYAVGNAYWVCASADEARNNGVGLLLNGSGGNLTISWNGGYAKSSWTRWPPNLQDIRRYQERSGFSMLQAIKTMFIKPIIPDWMEKLRRSNPAYSSWMQYSSLNPDLAHEFDIEKRMREAGHDPLFGAKEPSDSRLQLSNYHRLDRQTTSPAWAYVAGMAGLHATDPTFDKRVIEFCLSIPGYLHFRDGIKRWPIRQALAEYLPPEVVWYRRHGEQAADLALRARNSSTEIDQTLSTLEKSSVARRFLDLDRMRSVFNGLKGPITQEITSACDFILMRGIGVGLFLQRFE